MPTLRKPSGLGSALALSTALGLTLSACRLDDANILGSNFPLPGAAAPFDFVPAPGALELPYAEPAPVWPAGYDGGYDWAERAYALDHAFHEAPPDYAFYHDDVQPWAWQTDDDWLMLAEPISEDDYRFYYYEPEAYHPYFVRDDRYGYAYDDRGRLVSVYDLMGRILPTAFLYEQDDIAGRYWTRARSLRDTWRQAPRLRVAEPLWEVRQPVLVRAQTPWIEAASGYGDWRAYRARTNEKDLRRFEKERRKREKEIVRLARTERSDRAVFRDDRQPVQEAVSLVEQRDRRVREARDDERRVERIQKAERHERQKPDRAQPERRQKMEERRQAENRIKAERQQRQRAERADERREKVERRQAENRIKAERRQQARAESRQKPPRAEARQQKQAQKHAKADRGGGKAERGGKDRKG